MPRRRQLPGLPGPGAQGPRDGRKTAPKEKASKEEAFGEEGSKEEASEEAFPQAPGSWCPGPPGRPENGTFDQVNKVVDVAHGALASAPGSAGGACRCPSSFWTRKWTLQLEDAGGCGLLGLLRAAVRRGLSIRRRGRVHERLAFLSFFFHVCQRVVVVCSDHGVARSWDVGVRFGRPGVGVFDGGPAATRFLVRHGAAVGVRTMAAEMNRDQCLQRRPVDRQSPAF